MTKFKIIKDRIRMSSGFTFIEIIIVTAIFLILLALITPAVFNFQSTANSDGIIETLLADIKNQQIKAMTGDTEGRGIPDTYGVQIQPSSYVLFHGQNFLPQDDTNFTIDIDSQFQIVSTYANNSIIFASGSGEITNFSESANQIIIREERTGKEKTIELNKYGTITSVN